MLYSVGRILVVGCVREHLQPWHDDFVEFFFVLLVVDVVIPIPPSGEGLHCLRLLINCRGFLSIALEGPQLVASCGWGVIVFLVLIFLDVLPVGEPVCVEGAIDQGGFGGGHGGQYKL